ncbi:MAG: PaaI family thioesterase [Phaeovulum sp.]|uniref:PaaI family thioesterase n=1 Tax=Phaeovulum sp. TaxID=2934796 RepID=UPI0027312DD3|nr:PaaI family thioesterase [Phaeovulum sp.]MDP2063690.1 PaaI family thioesterase [Phaeovulum sp.]
MPYPVLPRIAASFAQQAMMRTIGAQIVAAESGCCEISAPLLPQMGQQHGAGHAGVTFALGDTAAGYAALTVMEPEREVMTAEMKINLVAPAVGVRLIARGRVVKAGRRLDVVTAEVEAEAADGCRRLVAVLQGTMVPVDQA